MNQINIIGNICHNLELKTTPNGKYVCSFNIAVKRPFSKDITDFFTVVCWNKQAENVCKYCQKGFRIGISGILTARQWKDKDENTRTAYEILANEVDFLEKRLDASQSNAQTFDDSPASDGFTAFEGFAPIDADSDLPF